MPTLPTSKADDEQEKNYGPWVGQPTGLILSGSARNDKLQGTSRNDVLDGGAGSDEIDAGSGNDLLIWRMSENAGARDRYDGGSGIDTLRLEFTRAEWMRADVQADIARFLAFVGPAAGRKEGDERGEVKEGSSEWFGFRALGLDVRKIELLEVRVDGVSLDPKDEAVVAVNDAATVNEDGSVGGNVLANDLVPDLVKSVELVSGTARGTLVFNADGSYAYTPGAVFNSLAQGQTAIERFSYRVTDADGDSSVGTVVITITGSNDGPVITNAAPARVGSVTEDGAVAATGQLSATDVDNGATQAWSIQGGATGTYGSIAVNSATGQWTYTLDNANQQNLAQGESHVETFTIRVTDDKGAFVDQTVSVTVNGTNDGPVITNTAAAQIGAVTEDTALTVTGQLTATDVDHGATQAWSVQGGATGTYGSIAVNSATGQWTYTLDNAAHQNLAAGESHVETFTIRVTDDKGAFVDQTVSVTVNGTNDGPVITNTAEALAGAVTEDTALTASGQLSASDIDNNATRDWSVQGSATGTYGSIAVDATGQWTYTLDNAAHQNLAAGESHVDTFTIRVTDDQGAFVDQTVSVTVNGTNDGPVITNTAEALASAVTEDTALTVTGQLSATDVDHGATQAWSVRGAAVGTYGSIAVNSATGQWTYTLDNATHQNLAQGESHVETFTIRITDDKGAYVDQTVSINVNGTNDGPVITNTVAALAGAVTEDTALTVTGQLTATDVDHGATQAWSVQGGATGTYGSIAVNSATGQWTYTLDNANHQNLAAGESHVDTFTIRVTDDQGAFVDQTVSVTVNGTNDGPVITNTADALAGAVTEDTALTVTGQLSATDIDNNATRDWSVQGAATGTYGSIAVDASGQWIYTLDNAAHQNLAAGESHVDTFTIRVTDDQGAFVDQTVSVTVNGTNDGPVITNTAEALAGAVTEDTALTATGQLSATDVDHGATQAWSVQGTATGTYGSIAVDAFGQWTYTLDNANHQNLAAGESHVETFTIRVTDDKGAFVDQTVSVTVNGNNDGPVITNTAAALAGAVTEDTALTVTGQLAATDVDHGATQAWSVQGTATGTYGSIAVSSTGQWTYTLDNANHQSLAQGESHVETFKIRVTDDQGAYIDQTVSVTVTGTNDGPVIGAGIATGGVTELANNAPDENIATHTANGSLAFGDVDLLDGHTVSVQAGGAGYRGTLVASIADDSTGEGAGSIGWTFTVPDSALDDLEQGQVLTQTYTVSISDGHGGTASRELTLTLTGAADNQAPVAVADTLTTNEDTALTVSATTLLANDTDPDAGDTKALVSVQGATHGTVSLANGEVTFTPDADYNGAASFSYTMRDAAGETSTAAVSVTVDAVNDAPVITLPSGNAAWTMGNEFRVNASAAGTQMNPDVAVLRDGSFVVAWMQDINGQSWEVMAKHYDAAGHVLKPDFQLNLTTAGNQLWPTLTALPDGGFFAAWSSNVPGSGTDSDIVLRRYDAQASPVSGEIVPHQTTAGFQAFQSLTSLSDGRLVVTWASQGQEAAGAVGLFLQGYGVYGRIYDSAGNAQGNEFHINTTIDWDQRSEIDARYSVAGLADGGFVSVWYSGSVYSGDYGVFGQRFAANGSRVGGEFRLSAMTDGDQTFANVAALRDGGFVVSWESTVGDGSGKGVFVRRYGADGQPLTGDLQVNVVGSGAQQFPHLVALADGGFAVTWESGQQNNGTAITWLRRYDAEGNPLTGEVRVGQAPLNYANSLAALEATADGGLVLAWASNGQDAQGNEVYARVVSGSGGPLRVAEDATLAIDGVSVADVDAGSSALSMTIAVSHGTLALALPAGGGLALAGEGTATLSITGSAAEINAALGTPGALTYRGQADYNGADTLTVTVNDQGNTGAGGAKSAARSVPIEVTPVNDAPVAVADTLTTNEDTAITVSATTLLANDTDPDAGDTKTLVSVQGAVHGTVSLAGGEVTFTPDADYNGAASFSYTMRDAAGETSTAAVNVTVNPVNDAAIISGDHAASLIETNVVQTVSGQLIATDIDSPATFRPQSATAGQYGNFSIGTDGAWTYTMNSAHDEFVGGQSYSDSFTVATADGTTQSVSITIAGSNDAAIIGASPAIDLGSYGKLIAPVQVDGGTWYYYWDRSGDGTSGNSGALNGGVDYTTHDVLDAIFNRDINGVVGGDGNTTDTYRYATLNGVDVALPTVGGQSEPPYGAAGINNFQPGTSVGSFPRTSGSNAVNTTYNDLLAVWDAYNSTGIGYADIGTPAGWQGYYYWSATPSAFGHAYVLLNGVVSGGIDGYNFCVALQVLSGSDSAVITESNAAQSANGQMSATDVDSPATFVAQSAVAGSNGYGHFSVNTAGVWTYTMDSAHDEFAAGQAYTDSFTVVTADGTAQVVAVTINGSNDAPVITSAASVSVAENTAGTVYTASASDPDSTGLTYSLGGTDAALFNIDATTGAVSFKTAPDYEAPADAGGNNVYDITVSASDGLASSSARAVAISVTDVIENRAPTLAMGDGKAIVALGASNDYGRSLAVQLDGKIVVAGYSSNGIDHDYSLIRLNPTGSLDTGFDGDGKAIIPVGSFDDISQSLVVQADGKILVAGYSYLGAGLNSYDYSIIRLNANGSLDTSFDGDGKAIIPAGASEDYGHSMTVQADGKILVAGHSGNSVNGYDYSLIRLNADGSLDTSFDGDGKAIIPVGTSTDVGWSITLQADSKILAAGSSFNGSNYDFSLIRLNTNGSLDTSFDGDGKVIIPVGALDDNGHGLALQSDGKILVAGYSSNGTNDDYSVVRLKTDGSLDTSFDGDGKVMIPVANSNDTGQGIAVQSDGKIVVSGFSINGSNYDYSLIRLNADGSLDTGFDGDGKVTVPVGSAEDFGFAPTLQSDGKILVAGFSAGNIDQDYSIIRLNPNGSLDTTFDVTPASYVENAAPVVLNSQATVFDADLAASGNYAGASLTLSRSGGANAQDLFSGSGTLGALVEGASFAVGGTTLGTVVHNSAGSLTLTFNANATQGLVNQALQQIAYANSSDAPPASVTIDWTFSDGNTGAQGIGGTLSGTATSTVLITAVNDAPTLSLPTVTVTVPGSGKIIVPFALPGLEGKAQMVEGLALQADGRIVLAGYRGYADLYDSDGGYYGSLEESVVARLNHDGSPDLTFDGDGQLAIARLAENERTNAIAIGGDGSIILTGTSTPYTPYSGFGSSSLTVTKVLPSGALDTGFSQDGRLQDNFSGRTGYGKDVQVQSDGSIVVLGSLGDPYQSDLALRGYSPTGSLLLYSQGGTPGAQAAASLSISPDNWIAYSYHDNWNFNGTITVSLDPTGEFREDGLGQQGVLYQNGFFALDTAWAPSGFVAVGRSAGGQATVYNGGYSVISGAAGEGYVLQAVAVQRDGKIVAAGWEGGVAGLSGNHYFVARLHANGTMDNSFGSGGKVVVPVGLYDYATDVSVDADGKIVVAGTSDGNFSVVRLNQDGSLDTTFGATRSTASTVYAENGAPVVLNGQAAVFDADLSASGNYAGASITLSRSGGANAQDLFSGSGTLGALVEGASFAVGGTTLGTVAHNSAGSLTLTFNANATQGLVNQALQQIAYANSSDAPPASVSIDWTFSDGNAGVQGTGGTLSGTATSTVVITAVNDAPVITSATSVSVAENTAGTVYTATASDPDGTGLTYSLGGTDAALFNIDANTGAVSFKTAPDYEAPADAGGNNVYDITVSASDGVASSSASAVAIKVTDVGDTAGVPVIDLGGLGKLIAPVQVDGGKWYYYWDRSGDGTSADAGGLNHGTDTAHYYELNSIFNHDANGVVGGGGITTDTYRYATFNGVHVALPTVGAVAPLYANHYGYLGYTPTVDRVQQFWQTALGNGSVPQSGSNAVNPYYDDVLAIWDAYNGVAQSPDINFGFGYYLPYLDASYPGRTYAVDSTPPGWYSAFQSPYATSTQSVLGHYVITFDNRGLIFDNPDSFAGDERHVVLQVL